MKKPSYCKHFCGTVEPVCGAGVNIRELAGGPDYGWCTRLPCNSHLGERDPSAVVHCDKYEEPTPEEIAEEELFMAQMMDRHIQSAPWVDSIRRAYAGKDAAGTDRCPICAAPIYWSISAYNGHVHATCSTDGCLRFME